MKMESLFKNKKQKVVYVILFTVMIVAFIYLGTVNFNDGETDAEKFSSEFSSVSTENVYVYSTAEEILNAIEDDAIVLFGSSLNDFTEKYANIINEIATEGITYLDEDGNEVTSVVSKIYYYDFFSDRVNNDANYEMLVEELTPYLLTDDTGSTDIYAPTFMVVKDGFVLYINEEVNFVNGSITPEDYWTDLQVGTFEETLKAVFSDFMEIN